MCIREKKNQNDISPILNSYYPMKGQIFVIKKIKRINNAGLFSEASLIIFTKGANNSDHDCTHTHTHTYTFIFVFISYFFINAITK